MAKVLSESQVKLLQSELSFTGPDLLFKLLLQGGLRSSELYRIRLDDLDQAQGVLWVKASKGSDNHHVALKPTLFKATQTALESFESLIPLSIAQPSSETIVEVFTASLRRHWGRRRFQLFGTDGRTIGLHSLRATAATNLIRRGVDLRTVQSFLGHRSIASTQIYLRPLEAGSLRKYVL